MNGLIDALRDLSALKHDDFSIGDEAADALESMQSDIATLEQENRQMRARMERYEKELHRIAMNIYGDTVPQVIAGEALDAAMKGK